MQAKFQNQHKNTQIFTEEMIKRLGLASKESGLYGEGLVRIQMNRDWLSIANHWQE